MYINFSDIPGHQNLFLDYLNEFNNVEKFYKRNFRDQESYEDLLRQLAIKDRPHRAALADAIRSQYDEVKTSKPTQTNIEALYSPKTIAVVTGQQLGILGGPIYTIYKTITAIKLCNYLKEKYEGYHFVPIFWLEGDDHDYEEVRSVNLVNNDNRILNIKYDDGNLDEINRGNIGHLKFTQNIEQIFSSLLTELRETEFKKQLVEFLQSIYQPEKTFLETFREIMIRLFDEHGLIVFNPLDPGIKKLLIPIFTKEITSYRDHTGILVERSAELEELYHAQVKVKAINLFYIDDNERLLIEPVDNDYRLKGKRKRFTQEDLLSQVNFTPERFSPNVLLRPICQDYLFPTAFYVGGPGEISYFAQVTPLYDLYDITEPIIYPRSSATILEKGVQSILEKYNLNLIDIFLSEDELVTKVIMENAGADITNVFGEAIHSLNQIFHPINDKLNSIDKTLSELSNKSKERMEQTIEFLKSKAIEAEKRKHEATIRQLGKVRNVLYPNDNLQERELNFLYFINKYGTDVLKYIIGELAINKFEHQVIEL
ncbi:MAG: bacillithiol biosynthesis cysteine-adding enzyme BshC [Melioribacteraceae bacterium]|nr:bacillithiol biosynthesis cysteine-adding enzyme BshC [Melioribacteraceae bacterium]